MHLFLQFYFMAYDLYDSFSSPLISWSFLYPCGFCLPVYVCLYLLFSYMSEVFRKINIKRCRHGSVGAFLCTENFLGGSISFLNKAVEVVLNAPGRWQLQKRVSGSRNRSTQKRSRNYFPYFPFPLGSFQHRPRCSSYFSAIVFCNI